MSNVECLLAALVFSASATAALQLWGQATAVLGHHSQQQLWVEQIETNRLQLEAHWRARVAADSSCTRLASALVAAGADWPVPAPIERHQWLEPDGRSVLVRWSVVGKPLLQRQQLFSPAGLGLCRAASIQSAP